MNTISKVQPLVSMNQASICIDMHMHSHFSDGSNSFNELLEIMERKNIKLFSVTDHNFISTSISLLQEQAQLKGIRFLQGIEISSVDRCTGQSLHILGYGLSLDTELLNNFLQDTIKCYNDRAKNIIRVLNEKYYGINLKFEKIKESNLEAYISRKTIAEELVNYLGKDKISLEEAVREAFVKESDEWMLDSSTAVELIVKARGVAVLAHPGRLARTIPEVFEEIVDRLIKFGLGGIEAEYPKHDQKTIDYIRNVCNSRGVIPTAGSDWHGTDRSDVDVGRMVSHEEFRKICKVFENEVPLLASVA